MAKTVIVQLIDDLDGSDAEETISFSIDGKSYQIDLNSKNATAFRGGFAKYIDKSRSLGRQGTGGTRQSASTAVTLFSQLSAEEKERFRAWANMPEARRIADSRVKEWIAAGRP